MWVCASTSETGLPLEATLITDIWKDTGILPPLPETGLPIDDKVLAIREGTLSPLAIKRPRPVLHKFQTYRKISMKHEKKWGSVYSVLSIGTCAFLDVFPK